MPKVKIEVFQKETSLGDGHLIHTTRVAYRCPKCDKAITSKYYRFCPYCGEQLEFEGETK